MLQRAIILLYEGVVQRLAFNAIQGRAAQPEPFCPSVEPDGACPEHSPGSFVWVPWLFHAAGSTVTAGPRYLPVPGLCRRGSVMPWLPGWWWWRGWDTGTPLTTITDVRLGALLLLRG